MIYAVSACLIGENCKYSGGNNLSSKVESFLKDKEWLAICPEVAGGLGVPREPAEISICGNERCVITKSGKNVTKEYVKGCEICFEYCMSKGVNTAILKSKSPSCGKLRIYDGTFTHTMVAGNGIFAEKLIENGIAIFTEEDIYEL